MNSESKHIRLLHKAVANNDIRSLKKLLKAERYDFIYFTGALTKAAAANNVDAVQLLLDDVQPGQVTDALKVVFRAAAKVRRSEFIRFTAAQQISAVCSSVLGSWSRIQRMAETFAGQWRRRQLDWSWARSYSAPCRSVEQSRRLPDDADRTRRRR